MVCLLINNTLVFFKVIAMILSSRDAELVKKTLIIGLPAAGKSTITKRIAERLTAETGIKLEKISTDTEFTDAQKDPGNPIITQFLKDYNIPESDRELLRQSPAFMAKYSEEAFRDLESRIIVNMLENGALDNKIVDLGGKAILHPRTANALKNAGYKVVYLNPELRLVTGHVLKDFCGTQNGKPSSRSNIDSFIQKRMDDNNKELASMSWDYFKEYIQDLLAKKDKKSINEAVTLLQIRNIAARTIVQNFHNDRHERYKAVSDGMINITSNLDRDVNLVLTKIREINSGSLTVFNKHFQER